MIFLLFNLQPGHCDAACHIYYEKQQQTDDHNENNNCKHFVKRVCLFYPCHVNTKTVKASQPLRYYGTYYCVGCGDLQPGKELGQGRGEFHMAENLHSAGAHCFHQADGIRVYTLVAVQKPDGDGEKVVITTKVIFGAIPKPIHNTRIGAMAMVGMVWVMIIIG